KAINHKVEGVQRYDGNWVMTSDTKEGVDYIVTYAIPSWDQQFGKVGPDWPNAIDTNSIFKPGWIGLHSLDGKISIGDSNGNNYAYKIPCYETDEPILDPNGNAGTGHDYGYDGDVEVYPDADGKGGSTVLWCGAIYGFGVFRGQNVRAAITQQPLSATKTEGESITSTAAGENPTKTAFWVTLVFSERVTPDTAGSTNNYAISGGVVIPDVVVNSETTVTLNTSAQTEGTEYTLTVNNIKDQSRRGNVIAANTTRKYTLALTPGYLLWEFYPNISGTAVDALTGDPTYPDNPARREFLTSFSTIPEFTADFADTYGARVSGW